MKSATYTSTLSSLFAVPSRASVLRFVAMCLAARQQRSELRKLDDARLSDLGLTRTQAKAEAERSFWDVPANWRA